MSSLLHKMYKLLDINQTCTSPDGSVETYNGILKFTAHNEKTLDEFMPYLAFSYKKRYQNGLSYPVWTSL